MPGRSVAHWTILFRDTPSPHSRVIPHLSLKGYSMADEINAPPRAHTLDRADETQTKAMNAEDLRGKDASRTLDRSAHRRSTFLYEDLLN